MTLPEVWHNFRLYLSFISMVVVMVVVVFMRRWGGGGRLGSSWCSKCMFLILSVNQPEEINYMI